MSTKAGSRSEQAGRRGHAIQAGCKRAPGLQRCAWPARDGAGHFSSPKVHSEFSHHFHSASRGFTAFESHSREGSDIKEALTALVKAPARRSRRGCALCDGELLLVDHSIVRVEVGKRVRHLRDESDRLCDCLIADRSVSVPSLSRDHSRVAVRVDVDGSPGVNRMISTWDFHQSIVAGPIASIVGVDGIRRSVDRGVWADKNLPNHS